MSTPQPQTRGWRTLLASALRMAGDATARRYAVIGMGVTLASYALLYVLVTALSLPSVISNFLTLVFGLTLSFLLYRNIAFRHRGATRAALARFVCVVGVAYGLNLLVLYYLVTHTPLSELVAQFLAFGAYSVLAYLFHRLWTFAGRPA